MSCWSVWRSPRAGVGPRSCSGEPWVSGGRADPGKIRQVLASIPTDFKISTCHADLLSLSAEVAVDKELKEIKAFFSR